MNYAIFLGVLIVLGGAYISWCIVTPRPERTLYGFLVLWCFVPKAARVIYFAPGAEDWPEGVTVYTALELIAFLGIAGAVFTRRKDRIEPEVRPIIRYAYVLAATGILSIVAPFALQQFEVIPAARVWSVAGDLLEPQWRLMGATPLVYGAIFALGCAAFLRTKEQIEPVFLILVLLGVELAVEAVLLFLLHLAPSLDKWEVSLGRFNSLSFYSSEMVALASLLTIGSMLYFAATRRSPRWLLLLPVLLLPALLSFERAPLLGIGAELSLAAWLLGGKWKVYALAGAGLVALAVTLANVPLVETLTAALGQNVRPDYLSPETGHIRIALYLRGLDSIVFLFPFGAGPGMLRYAMSFEAPELLRGLNTTESMTTYAQVAGGGYLTSSHNAFIEFIGENGILGVVALAMFSSIVIGNLWRWNRTRRSGAPETSFVGVVQACTYSMLLGLLIFIQFDTTILPQALFVMLLWFTFLPFAGGTADA